MSPIELYDFQKVGIPWLAQRRTALLADEMGLGKSVQAILAADLLHLNWILVICPAKLREDWRQKFRQWSTEGRPVYVLAPGVAVAMGGEKAVLIMGMEAALDLRKILRERFSWDLIVVDEGQNFKNPTAKRTRALYGGYCQGLDGIISVARRVWVLSGTPTPNGDPRELYPHLRALLPAAIIDPNTGRPYTYGAWGDHFCQFSDEQGDKCVGVKNMHEIRAILDGWMLRRTAEVANLPPLRFTNLFVDPGDVDPRLHREHWPELSQELDAVLEAAVDRDLDFVRQQEVSTIRRLTGLIKANLAVEVLKDELKDGSLEQVIVVCHHRDVIEHITTKLFPWGACKIMGGMTDTETDDAVKAFQAGHKRVISIQMRAGGVGITLTAAHHVFFVESSGTPVDNWQAAARARRIGQHHPVLARVLTLAGTVDEPIQRTAVRRANQIREVHSL